MVVSTGEPKDKQKRAEAFMRAGLVAKANGNRRRAFDLLRRAAAFIPYDEQVWIALLDVLDDPRDRRICLENIIAINPYNYKAHRQLTELDPPNTYDTAPVTALISLGDLSRDPQDTTPLPPVVAVSEHRARTLLRVGRRLLQRIVLIILLGILMVLIISGFAILRATLLT